MNFLIAASTDTAAAALLLFAAKTKGLSVDVAEEEPPKPRYGPSRPKTYKKSARKKCPYCRHLYGPQGLPKHLAWHEREGHDLAKESA